MEPLNIIMLIVLIIFIVFSIIYIGALLKILIQKKRVSKINFTSELLSSINNPENISYEIGEKLIIVLKTDEIQKTITNKLKIDVRFDKKLSFETTASKLKCTKPQGIYYKKKQQHNSLSEPWNNYKKSLKKIKEAINVY